MSDHKELRLLFTPMQYSDKRHQHVEDAETVFSRRAHAVAGTEADPGLRAILRRAATRHGYLFAAWRGEWIGVRSSLVDGGWNTGGRVFVESYEGHGKHSDRGICTVAFTNHQLGRLHFGVGHYLTKGRAPADPNYKLNTRMAEGIGKWGQQVGAGSDLVFYAGDQNISDRRADTFRGEPFTSIQDELREYENTGHGPIDVWASYDRDGRVKGVSVDVLAPGVLHSDHYGVEAVYQVRKLQGPAA